ncbi:MAG TPA: hypothetical protein VGB15_08685 [Longimicrobium sp.]|jgi:hypothetical protein
MSTAAGFAGRPASEMEWEDLLVRYEIGPRALRFALADGDADGPARGHVAALLHPLVAGEIRTAAAFEAMRTGVPLAPADAESETAAEEPGALVDRFDRLRARNFAAVQRRGLEVWDWRIETHPHGAVTAHQLIQSSVALDGETLAAVRAALRGAAMG